MRVYRVHAGTGNLSSDLRLLGSREGSVPDSVRVVPEDLHMSAGTVDVHADNVHLRHAAADGRIEGAQPGLPAGSAAALGTAMTKWQADTAALFGRMMDHSSGLRAGAAGYRETDDAGGGAIDAASAAINPDDMGL